MSEIMKESIQFVLTEEIHFMAPGMIVQREGIQEIDKQLKKNARETGP